VNREGEGDERVKKKGKKEKNRGTDDSVRLWSGIHPRIGILPGWALIHHKVGNDRR
jgi:hypothetical protein